MAYECVLLRIKKTGYSEPVLLLLVYPGRTKSNGVVADSHRQLATGKRGEKKNMSESKTVVMSSSGTVSVSLSVTYIYILEHRLGT